jgi:hypothetical protein
MTAELIATRGSLKMVAGSRTKGFNLVSAGTLSVAEEKPTECIVRRCGRRLTGEAGTDLPKQLGAPFGEFTVSVEKDPGSSASGKQPPKDFSPPPEGLR